ncbi:hypothetical protein [Streptomyces cinerochromogenes]|uniref:hypothetical protein n=1 Tax=Streptomyces cinerochromogenes TaxID=66422 RepID=UPI0033B1DD8E
MFHPAGADGFRITRARPGLLYAGGTVRAPETVAAVPARPRLHRLPPVRRGPAPSVGHRSPSTELQC